MEGIRIPIPSPDDISGEDFDNVNLNALKEAIKLYDMNRSVGHMSRVEIIEGDATKTIDEYVKKHPELIIALLYIDFDIYKPTKVALEKLAPLVCKGGIIAFDQIHYDKFAGETRALKEYLDLNQIKIEVVRKRLAVEVMVILLVRADL